MNVISKWLAISSRNGQIFFAKKFEGLGFGSGQYMFIIGIYENPGLTQDQLAEVISINKGTVANVLKTLEKDGFVERRQNVKDKRIHNLYLTEKGINSYVLIKKTVEEWNDLLLRDIPKDEVDKLDLLLRKITDNAKKYAKGD